MAKTGRPRKPTAKHKLEGTFRPDRHNADEPAAAGSPEPCGLVGDDAREMWAKLVPILEVMGVLTLADGPALTVYCNAFGRMRNADRHMAEFGWSQTNDRTGIRSKSPEVFIQKEAAEVMHKVGAAFGLTPADRTRIQVESGGTDETADFLFGQPAASEPPKIQAVK